MDIYRVSFIGHREVEHYREIDEQLSRILPELLRSHDFVEFQMGRNGEFDIFIASYIKRMEQHYGKERFALTLILPYPVADLPYYEKYYDDILIPEEAQKAHPKAAITKRNRWMVENSELLIAYVRRTGGGAATCLKMAEKAGIEIIRI